MNESIEWTKHPVNSLLVIHMSSMCILWYLNPPFNPGIYFSVCLALMVISLLETVIITNVLHHNSMKYKEVPTWVRVVVLKHIANLICYQWPEHVKAPATPQKDEPEILNGDSGVWVVQPASRTPAQDQTSSLGDQTKRNDYFYWASQRILPAIYSNKGKIRILKGNIW